MQHPDRAELLAAIAAVVDEVYGGAPDGGAGTRLRARLRARLGPLLTGLPPPPRPVDAAEVTILLADIRGYTALSRTLPPRAMAALLNRWFVAMCQVVHRYGGLVDKFMGDSVMALFGAPRRRPDDLPRALACAAEMQQVMTRLNRESERAGQPPLYIGVALNTGPVMAGSFGSDAHSEYTVIGDAVNLAARIEAFSLRGQVLLSAASFAAAAGLVEVGAVNEVRVKGLGDPVTLYELLALHGPRRLVVPRVEPRRSPRILVDLPAAFRPLESKIILPRPISGRVLDLSYHGMRAQLPTGLPTLSEVVVDLDTGPRAGQVADLYARVVRSRPGTDGWETSLALTALGSPGQRLLKQLVDEALWGR